MALKYDFFTRTNHSFSFCLASDPCSFTLYVKMLPCSNVTIIIYIDVHIHFVVVFDTVLSICVLLWLLFCIRSNGIYVNTDLFVSTACVEPSIDTTTNQPFDCTDGNLNRTNVKWVDLPLAIF